MKNLGPLCCVLGIEVSYRPGDHLFPSRSILKTSWDVLLSELITNIIVGISVQLHKKLSFEMGLLLET